VPDLPSLAARARGHISRSGSSRTSRIEDVPVRPGGGALPYMKVLTAARDSPGGYVPVPPAGPNPQEG
jgi:hypothetical protein